MSDPDEQSADESALTAVFLPYRPFPSFAEWCADYVESDTLDRAMNNLAQAREGAPESAVGASFQTVARWAAIDTGAIEGLYDVDRGFTYNVAVSTVMLEQIADEKGDDARRSVEDALAAYDYVLDASTGAWPINESWIRSLHEILTRSQETFRVLTPAGWQDQQLAHGEYKTHANNPFNVSRREVHSYAPPIDTPPEMRRLVEELAQPEFKSAGASVQAAYSHYAFVAIHPFSDGNGRVARALASTFLYRALSIPLVVFADQKAQYLDALEAADSGSYTRFNHFVQARVLDTLNTVREQILAAAVPDVQRTLDDLSGILRGAGGLPHEVIDVVALSLLSEFKDAAAAVFSEAVITEPMKAHEPNSAIALTRPWDSFRAVPNSGLVELTVTSSAPATAKAHTAVRVGVRLPGSEGPAFVLASESNAIEFEAALDDLYPAVTTATRYRLRIASQRILRGLVADAAQKATRSLRDAGYL